MVCVQRAHNGNGKRSMKICEVFKELGLCRCHAEDMLVNLLFNYALQRM